MGVQDVVAPRKLHTFFHITISGPLMISTFVFLGWMFLNAYAKNVIFAEKNLIDIAYNGFIKDKPNGSRPAIGFDYEKTGIDYAFTLKTMEDKWSSISFVLLPLNHFNYNIYNYMETITEEKIKDAEAINKNFFDGKKTLSDKKVFFANSVLANILQITYLNYTSWASVVLWTILSLIFLKYYRNKYIACPHKGCGKSVRVKERWKCDNCYHVQGKERYIYRACEECKRHLSKVYCEHCDGGLII